ncbi:MAG: hypothetical protein OCD02_00175 [Spirochaetaceae bacterium]
MSTMLITRLAYTDLYEGISPPSNIEQPLLEIVENYNPSLLRDTIIEYLAKLNYYSQLSDPQLYYNLLDETSRKSFGSLYSKYKREYGLATIVTRQNLLFILKNSFVESKTDKKLIDISQLHKELSKINCFEDVSTDGEYNGDLSIENILKLLTDLFRSNFHLEKSKIILSEIKRNYYLMVDILETAEGKQANELLFSETGIHILDKIKTCYILNLCLIIRYKANDYSNIIDLNSDFNEFKDDSTTLITHLRTFFESFDLNLTVSNIDKLQLNNNYSVWCHPIEKLSKDKYRILDVGILIERCFRNTFLDLEDKFLNNKELKEQKRNVDLRSNALGHCFEKSVEDFFKNKLKLNLLNNKYTDGQEITDLIIKIDDSLIFIEIKAGYLPIRLLSSYFNEEILMKILSKYGLYYPGEEDYYKLPPNERKGTLQLLHLNGKISKGISEDLWEDHSSTLSGIKNIYNLVITQESSLSINFLNLLIHKYNKEYVNEISVKDIKYHAPIICNISDFSKIYTGNISLSDCLQKYCDSIINDSTIKFVDFIDENYNYPSYMNKDEYNQFGDEILQYFNIKHKKIKI